MTYFIHRCPGTPYTCDGYDPADWEQPPDFTVVREWEARQAGLLGKRQPPGSYDWKCQRCKDGDHGNCTGKGRGPDGKLRCCCGRVTG